MRTSLKEQLASTWAGAKRAKVEQAEEQARLQFTGVSPAKRQMLRVNVEQEVVRAVEDLKSTLERINNLHTKPDPQKQGVTYRTFPLARKRGRSLPYSVGKGYEKPYAKLATEWNAKWKVLQDAKAKLNLLEEI